MLISKLMAYEKVMIIAALDRKTTVRLEKMGEDVWDKP
jgi:hypothetical protein